MTIIIVNAVSDGMEVTMKLTGKKYIVTGASSGIGKETCKYLAKLGATVILIARNEVRLMECLEKLEGEGHKYYCFDLSKIQSIENLIKKIVDENGKLDGFVHSAGVSITRPIKNTTKSVMQEVFEINLFSFVELLRLFSFKKYNNGGGSVVGISSISSHGYTGLGAYSAAKAGLDTIVRVAAMELVEKNIRVNNVRPGWVRTKMVGQYIEDGGSEKNLSQMLEPVEVARVIAYLLSDEAVGINGVSIPITGKDIQFY